MKTFRLIPFLLLLCGQSVLASSLPELVTALHGADYTARLTSLNALESRIAQASAPSADAPSRAALERELLGYATSADLPELSRAYLIRLLPPIASEASLQPMLQLVLDPGTSRLLANDATGLIAFLVESTPPDKVMTSLVAASAPARGLLWEAMALRADDRLAKPLVKLFRQKKLPLDDLAIQTLGAMGGRDAASYLFTEWRGAKGVRRTALARAIVHTGAASTGELKQLCLKSEVAEIRAAALRQWAVKDQKGALAFLEAELNNDAADATTLLAVQLASGGGASWKWVTQRGAALSDAALITVLQLVREQQRRDLEPWVLQRLPGVNEPVELAGIHCLAVIGGSRSSEELLKRVQVGSGKVATAALNALAVLRDDTLDARLQAIVSDPEHPQYLTAYDLIARRNLPGSIDSFNRFFASRNPAGKELTAGLKGMESLGNLESVKLLLARLNTEQEPSAVRAVQISIKRVVLRIEQPERIWREAFAPVFHRSPGAEFQARVLPLLDAVSTPEALAICLERVTGGDAVLARAAEQALVRWRNIEVCDHWLSVINDPTRQAAEHAQAVRYIDQTLRSDAQADNPKQVVEKAAALFLASPNSDLREKLLLMIDGMEDHRKVAFHKELSPRFKDLPDHREKVEALINKNSKE